jgi:hypothetical protein
MSLSRGARTIQAEHGIRIDNIAEVQLLQQHYEKAPRIKIDVLLVSLAGSAPYALMGNILLALGIRTLLSRVNHSAANTM